VADDRDSFESLVERHSRSVFRVAYRLTGNDVDAEDVVQETFLRAYRQMDQFEARANFGTWLHRIAINCAYDLLRTRARHAARRDPGDPGEALAAAAAPEPGPDRRLLGSEIQSRIAGAMATLSPLERTAFTLRHFEQQSIEEIGRTLGLKSNATKHSIFRAVRKMRMALQPLTGGGV
jgi:RNA polymerase sigma-70 factor (ECF subfamily)